MMVMRSYISCFAQIKQAYVLKIFSRFDGCTGSLALKFTPLTHQRSIFPFVLVFPHVPINCKIIQPKQTSRVPMFTFRQHGYHSNT